MAKSPFRLAVLAALLLGSPAAAQPPTAQQPQQLADAPQDQATQSTVRPKVEIAARNDEDAAAVVKRARTARISTCRCGGTASSD
jgi:hypothetical protein